MPATDARTGRLTWIKGRTDDASTLDGVAQR